MAVACPTHGIVTLQDEGQPQSRFFEIQHRIADRFGPDVAEAFVRAVEATRDQVDLSEVESAVRAGDLGRVEAALRMGSLRTRLQEPTGMAGSLSRTYATTGDAAADVLSKSLGVDFSLDARDPNAIIFARSQTATLVRNITTDQEVALRGIMGRAFQEGVEPRRTARFIREVVGLRKDHMQAVFNFQETLRAAQELGGDELVGKAISSIKSRRLDAATQQKLISALKKGTLTSGQVAEAVQTYRTSLLNYRALSIARTETIRASSAGQHEGFMQARRRGVLPDTSRRFWVVTPDDRLRETHAQVPFDNPNGVPVDEPFETPLGSVMYPPLGVQCRCGVALVPNPDEGGII